MLQLPKRGPDDELKRVVEAVKLRGGAWNGERLPDARVGDCPEIQNAWHLS
jgi:hypothetical protein